VEGIEEAPKTVGDNGHEDASRREDAVDLAHDGGQVADVFEDVGRQDAVEDGVTKGEGLGVGADVAGLAVHIDEARVEDPSASEVEEVHGGSHPIA
jgi:hypothetical protein